MHPVIETPRVRLLPVGPGDTDAICALLWLPDVRRYLCDDTLVPRATVESFIAESLDPGEVTSYWRIAIDGSACAGLIGWRPPSQSILPLRAIGWRSLEILIALDPRFWGQGLACEALEAVRAHAGSDGVTFALVGAVDEPNERSHRLLRRAGFHELGRVKGPVHPLVVYERTV